MQRTKAQIWLKYLLICVILVSAYKVLHYYRLTYNSALTKRAYEKEQAEFLSDDDSSIHIAPSSVSLNAFQPTISLTDADRFKVEKEKLSQGKLTRKAGQEFLTKLHADYPQVIARLEIPCLELDYPVVQGQDNDYYLNHNYQNVAHPFGAIFMDFQNKADGRDQNTVIYGHNVPSGGMFHALHKLTDADFKPMSPYIIFDTLDNRYIYRIFAVYAISETANYRSVNYSKADWRSFLGQIKEHNLLETAFPSELELSTSESARVLTLSTCSKPGERLVVHGVRVE